MHKLIVFPFLLFSVIIQGQNDQRKKDSLALSAPTEIGTPDGEPVSKKIGIDGGTLISSDNKITLIIPAGALLSETPISIQPTTNFAKGSMGKAYGLEPSGIQFQKPAQLVFRYTEKEMDGQSPQLMGVAWQNEKGVWKGLRKITLDTILKTITADIKHFSGYALGWAIILEPEKTRIKVSKDMVVFLSQREIQDAPGEEPTGQIFYSNFRYKINWFVNGIADGNNIVGKIVPVGTSLSRVYQAPAQVPDNNPVEIKVEITDIKLRGDQKITIIVSEKNTTTWTETYWTEHPNIMRKCNVRIYDNAYEVKMVSTAKGPAGDRFSNSIYKDEGSFVVSLGGKEAKIIEKINVPCKLEYKGRCTITILQPGSGNIHILDARSIIVTPPKSPGGPASVQIIFIRAPAILPLFNYDCPQVAKEGRYIGTNAMERALGAGMVPAFPMQINFEAKDEEQTILKIGEEGGEVYVKFTVKQIKDD